MPVKLAFEVLGEGPPVVILHGLFGSGRNWAPLAQPLAQRHRVYLPDARNHGASPHARTMPYGEMALDVLELIDREQVLRPAVIGHSMGGKTAMVLALEHPQAISRVAVIDIAPEPYADQFTPYVAAMRGLGHNLTRPDVRFDWRLNFMASSLCMPDLCGFPPQPEHRCFLGSALFVAGGDSGYVRTESLAGIARLFPHARVERIPGAGHWVHADRPQALLRALQRWLDETVVPAR